MMNLTRMGSGNWLCIVFQLLGHLR